MARRKPLPDEPEDHQRWLISYADFITLLFAFFVVMYAISQVNEGKYRVLSDALNTAFSPRDKVQLIESPVNDSAAKFQLQIQQLRAQKTEEQRQRTQERLRETNEKIRQALSVLTRDGQATVTDGAFGISIDLDAGFLFGVGEATVAPQARPILQAIAQVLIYTDFPLVIEGHTDNQPVSGRLGSNWELSALRAATVARVMAEDGILPARLTASGFGEQRPLADNTTPEGRARNRRVSLRIEAPSMEKRNEPVATGTANQDTSGGFSSSFPTAR